MDIVSLFISILTLIFSGYVFYAHDRKLNAQQKMLNELALQKAAQEKEASKKANIFLSREKINGSDKLVVTNKGQATAFDIKLSSRIDNDPVTMLNTPPQWPSLKPGQAVNRPLLLGNGVAMNVTYDISWRDELGEHTDQQMMDFY